MDGTKKEFIENRDDYQEVFAETLSFLMLFGEAVKLMVARGPQIDENLYVQNARELWDIEGMNDLNRGAMLALFLLTSHGADAADKVQENVAKMRAYSATLATDGEKIRARKAALN